MSEEAVDPPAQAGDCGFARRLAVLCRGDAAQIAPWIEEEGNAWPLYCCGVIVVGTALYGASIGLWQHPMQAVYAAVKFPLLIFLTVLGNAAINGMLAQVLGLGLTFRQTTLAILMSFVIVALFLGALTPLSLFLVYNVPPPTSRACKTAYSVILLTHVIVIAYAGVAANVRLFKLLERLSHSTTLALKILFAWLAGNMFLGTQLSWIMSPFIGDPNVPLQIIQDHILEKNFFEYAFERFMDLVQSPPSY